MRSRNDIAEVGIDTQGRLYIKPESMEFPFIYREAMGVHWDAEEHFLYSPKPDDWSYFQWFIQILSAVKSQGCQLILTNSTKWVSIPDDLRSAIVDAGSGDYTKERHEWLPDDMDAI